MFDSECIMASLRKKCVCPTCNVPVLIKGLHKNLTFSTLVACVGKLGDLIEAKIVEIETAKILEGSSPSVDADETQLPDILNFVVEPSAEIPLIESGADEIEQHTGKENRRVSVNFQLDQTPAPKTSKEESKSEGPRKRIRGIGSLAATPTPATNTSKSKAQVTKTTPVSAPVARKKATPAGKESKEASASTTVTPSRVESGTLRILLSGLKSDDKEMVLEYCGKIGKAQGVKAQVVNDLDARVNRIIMGVNEAGLCIRTTKYLRGILDGKTIVTFKWFLDSLAEMMWMDPSAYLVKGDTSIGKESGAVAASMASLSKLFAGYTFYLVGSFGSPSKPDLTSLMKAGGAKILQSKPKAHDPIHVIIYDPDHFNDEVLWIMEYPYRTSGHWLLDCISSFSILPLY